MFAQLVSTYHLHPIVDHFTIALLTFGIAAEILAAAAILLSRGREGFTSVWDIKLRSTSLLLMIGGAGASVLSYFTGDAEADRLWDTMSPAAQQITFILKPRRFPLPVACGSRTVPDVCVSDSWRLARDAGVVEPPGTHTNRFLDRRNRRVRRTSLPGQDGRRTGLCPWRRHGRYEGQRAANRPSDRRKYDRSAHPRSFDLTLVRQSRVQQHRINSRRMYYGSLCACSLTHSVVSHPGHFWTEQAR